MQNTIDTLRDYVKENEVIFQASGYLMDVASEVEKENRNELHSYFDSSACAETLARKSA